MEYYKYYSIICVEQEKAKSFVFVGQAAACDMHLCQQVKIRCTEFFAFIREIALA